MRSKCFALIATSAMLLSASVLVSSNGIPKEGSDTRGPAIQGMAGANPDPTSGFFIKNMGQVAGAVRYYSLGNPAVGFRDDGVMFVLREESAELQGSHVTVPDDAARAHAYLVRPEGARRVSPEPIDRLPFNANFFLGTDVARWRTDVPVFGGIAYRGIYDGIDMVYRYGGGGVKYEFKLTPGADPADIMMRVEGADSLLLAERSLRIVTTAGIVRDSRPDSYLGDGEEVACEFDVIGPDSFGFDCGQYDSSKPLTIDPLVYSTFLGGSLNDRGYSIKVDSMGSAYVAGQTYSADFPTTLGAFSRSKKGSDDAFVAKISPDGSSLAYSTFIGGSFSDIGISIALDSALNAYVAGVTTSANFPVTPGGYGNTLNGISDVFVAKLNQAGNALVYSTYLGGSGNETWPTVEVDPFGNGFVAGATDSQDFPTTPGAYSTSYNGGPDDAFLTKFDSGGSALRYSTFLGGDSNDFAYSLDIDSDANVYVTGGTFSANLALPAPGYDKTYNGDSDIFAAKVSANGSWLEYATYVGGTGPDYGLSIAVDSTGGAHLTGSTDSSDFPVTPNAYDKTKNSVAGYNDAFLIELDGNGTALAYSTYIGGSKRDYGNAMSLDDSGNVNIAGWTDSADLPATPSAFDATYNGNGDYFVAEIDSLGSLVDLTYLGGWQTEGDLPFMALDSYGAVYVTGITNSTDFPVTPGAFDTTLNPVRDAFVAKLGQMLPDLSVAASDISFTPQGPFAPGASVVISATIHNLGNLDAANVVVRFHDGPPSGLNQIGTDRIVSLMTANGGTGTALVSWIAQPSGDHDICVVVDPDDVIAELTEANNDACKKVAVGTFFHLQLEPGHHLISFPLKPFNDDITSILPSVSSCYRYVRLYDAADAADPWKSYMPGKQFNDLTRLDNTMGFWIDITAACELVVAGVLEGSTTLNLRHGWNMVGYPSLSDTYTVADLKADMGIPGVRVEVQDQGAGPYFLKHVDDAYVMKAGEGYWIFSPSDASWVVHA